MTNQKQYAVCLNMIYELSKAGSWCGETHIQKSLYIMQTLSALKSNDIWDFVLYKHGPYSFDLHSTIDDLKRMDFIEYILHPPYGPQIRLSSSGEKLLKKLAPETELAAKVSKMAKLLADKGVRQLESIGTALLLSRKPDIDDNDTLIAKKLHAVKPHIDEQEATDAVQEFRTLEKNFLG